jgi:L-ascorbate metabolism protein UlaG (beta-lactamase superfamily)
MSKVKLIYYGHAMFEIQDSTGKKIIIDPYNEQIRSSLPDVSGDIVISSHEHFDHANISLVKGNPRSINKPGYFEINGIKIEGIQSYHDTQEGQLRGENIIFKITVDDILFVHMGDLGHIPDGPTFNKLKGVDILMIPVGGIYTINANDATEIIKKIKPSITIPMHYKEADSKLEVDTVETFLSKWETFKKGGHSSDISKGRLPASTEVWVMDPR